VRDLKFWSKITSRSLMLQSKAASKTKTYQLGKNL
jgi:hypothetical protein